MISESPSNKLVPEIPLSSNCLSIVLLLLLLVVCVADDPTPCWCCVKGKGGGESANLFLCNSQPVKPIINRGNKSADGDSSYQSFDDECEEDNNDGRLYI